MRLEIPTPGTIFMQFFPESAWSSLTQNTKLYAQGKNAAEGEGRIWRDIGIAQ